MTAIMRALGPASVACALLLGASPATAGGIFAGDPTVTPGPATSLPNGSALFSGPAAPSTSAVGSMAGFPAIGLTAPAGANASANQGDSRGPDAQWGDPLNAGLYDSDSVHAGFNYYAGSSRGGSQGGFGFSLTFKN